MAFVVILMDLLCWQHSIPPNAQHEMLFRSPAMDLIACIRSLC
jgi:hypothetical protein